MEVLGSIYTEVSDRFQKGIIGEGISRCVKAEKHDLGVIMAEIQEKRLGNIYSFDGGNYAGNVSDKECISPTLKTMQGGNSQPMVVAMRGRNPDNPSDRAVGNPTEQRLEVNMQGTSNCLTSAQKDNLVMESQVLTPKRTEYGKQIQKAYESGQIQESRHNMTELEPRQDNVSNTLTTAQKDNLLLEKPQYRIRKLTPRECGRLMGVFDEDIDKMAAVNSNTQLYKQFGNSIVVDVMCAMFKNLNINQGDTV